MNYDYIKQFTKPSIKIGTITVVLTMLASFLPNIYLYFSHGIWPDMSLFLSGWGNLIVIFGAFYLVEPISYFPVFGITGTYIGVLAGSMAQIRLPAASTAQDVLGVSATSHKGEIVGILAICGSVVTNLAFLTLAVIAGSAIMSVLPESVSDALSAYILPSLFGACFANIALKKIKIALYALPMCVIMKLLGFSTWLMIIVAIFGTISITYVLYKKKIVQ